MFPLEKHTPLAIINDSRLLSAVQTGKVNTKRAPSV